MQGLEDGFQSLGGLEYQFEGEDFEDHHLGKQDHTLREDFFGDFDGEGQESDSEGGKRAAKRRRSGGVEESKEKGFRLN